MNPFLVLKTTNRRQSQILSQPMIIIIELPNVTNYTSSAESKTNRSKYRLFLVRYTCDAEAKTVPNTAILQKVNRHHKSVREN